jgi:nitroreductase
MDVSTAILTKRAVRQFQDQNIPQKDVLAILNAARRAQSSRNSQPWQFIAIQDRSMMHALSKTGHYAQHLTGAGLVVVIATPLPGDNYSIMFDAGQSAAYLQLAAWELGIGSCLATIHEPDKARELLGIPETFFVHIVISFGYPQDNEVLTRPSQRGGRKPLNDVVHWEVW